MWQAFPWSSSVWTKEKAQTDQISSWSARIEEAPVDGNGSVVETLAHGWSWIVLTAIRERHGQNGLFGDLREGLEMSETSVVEMATAPQERSGERQVGRTAPKAAKNLQMEGCGIDRGIASRNLSSCLQGGHILLRIVGDGRSSRNLGKPDFDAVLVKTQWSYASRHGGPSAPANWWKVYSTCGFEWLRMVVVAPFGVEW